jgi:CCR4-NOT transcription complex subunit 6
VYTGSSYAIDGCATFFRESRFSLVKKYEVEFNKAALSLSEALGPAASKKAALNRLLKDNVALIVVLEAKEHEGQEPPLQGQSKRQLLCVVSGRTRNKPAPDSGLPGGYCSTLLRAHRPSQLATSSLAIS